MIRIRRVDAPDILKRNAEVWKQNLLNAGDQQQRKATSRKYRHRQIKESLNAMFHGKCAYCESRITHIDYGHIEHYKPKTKFPELTFDWANLLLACGICNGLENKGDRFPEQDSGGPILNPCEDEPEQHLRFLYDSTTHMTSVYGVSVRGKTTVHLLGLNRHNLREYRSKQVKRLLFWAILLQGTWKQKRYWKKRPGQRLNIPLLQFHCRNRF